MAAWGGCRELLCRRKALVAVPQAACLAGGAAAQMAAEGRRGSAPWVPRRMEAVEVVAAIKLMQRLGRAEMAAAPAAVSTGAEAMASAVRFSCCASKRLTQPLQSPPLLLLLLPLQPLPLPCSRSHHLYRPMRMLNSPSLRCHFQATSLLICCATLRNAWPQIQAACPLWFRVHRDARTLQLQQLLQPSHQP